MSSTLGKSLGILELMARHPQGLPVSNIAERLDMPVSGVHRQLKELARLGYVRQKRSQGDYTLTIRLAALGLNFLGRAGVLDVAQPILDRLAKQSGELVRLAVLDNGWLVYVATVQGATMGLRYDPSPEQGEVLHLTNSAGGQAYLATLSDEDALQKITRQGILPTTYKPIANTPRTLHAVLDILKETRTRGYGLAINSYHEGMAAMASTIRYDGGDTVVGTVSVAGPEARMTPKRIAELVPVLTEAASDLGAAVEGSSFFRSIKRELEDAKQR